MLQYERILRARWRLGAWYLKGQRRICRKGQYSCTWQSVGCYVCCFKMWWNVRL